jgi:HEAT repeat protein
MSTRASAFATAALIALGLAVTAAAQQPRIANGRVTAQPAGTPFAASFKTLASGQADVTWIGYSVPAVAGDRGMCGSDGDGGVTYMNGVRTCCGGERLEPSQQAGGRTGTVSPATGPVKLEGPQRLLVLFRVEDRKVERIRILPEDCELDAGGRAFIWLDGVRPADSVALLESYATADPAANRRVADGAVTAIALHGDPAADPSLERLVAPSQPETLRRKVTFWLGNSRGARGLATLQRVLREDPSVEVRKGAVFGVSQSRESNAFDVLSALARTDQEPRIRSEAVFWLSQKGDSRAAAVITQALEKDSSPEVRKKAVFALSQLRDNAGVEALINVAKTNTDAAARSEAIFWLGQKASKQAASAITDRIDNDPNTDVKKRAVFALSQLPKDEGVPLLINVAKTNQNPEVRKQAMFWLGQSRDERAIAFFEEVLTRK